MRRSGNASFTYGGKEYSTFDNEKAEASFQKDRNQTTRFGNKRDGDPGEKESRDELEKKGKSGDEVGTTVYYDAKGKQLPTSAKRNYGTVLYDSKGNRVGKTGKPGTLGRPTYMLDREKVGPNIPKDLQNEKGQIKPGKPKTPAKPAAPSKPGGKTTAELWKEKTGTDWSKAKERGLTDGSAKSNLEMRKALEAGRTFEAAPEKMKSKASPGTGTTKPKAELQIRKPESKIPEMEPSKEVSFDSPSKMTTRKGQRLENKANRITARKTKKAETKEGREMVKAARKMKRGGRR